MFVVDTVFFIKRKLSCGNIGICKGSGRGKCTDADSSYICKIQRNTFFCPVICPGIVCQRDDLEIITIFCLTVGKFIFQNNSVIISGLSWKVSQFSDIRLLIQKNGVGIVFIAGNICFCAVSIIAVPYSIFFSVNGQRSLFSRMFTVSTSF